MSRPPPASSSLRLPLAILGALVLAVAAGAVWLALRGGGAATVAGNAASSDIDATRFAAYAPGLHLLTRLNTTIQGTISDKDWGLDAQVSFVHVGEAELLRVVEANDGRELRVAISVRQARNLDIKAKVAGLRLDPPPVAVSILKQLPIPGAEFTNQGIAGLNQALANGYVKDGLNRLVTLAGGEAALAGAVLGDLRVDEMEGRSATARYVNGQGLVSLDSAGQLSAAQEELLRRIDVVSEAHLLPDLAAAAGDTWTVDARHLAMLVDPAVKARIGGTVEFRRGADEAGCIRFEAIGGLVELRQLDSAAELLGRWSPRGSLLYDPLQHAVVSGQLTGQVEVSRTSRDHKLFEAKWVGKPTYLITIAGRGGMDAQAVLAPPAP